MTLSRALPVNGTSKSIESELKNSDARHAICMVRVHSGPISAIPKPNQLRVECLRWLRAPSGMLRTLSLNYQRTRKWISHGEWVRKTFGCHLAYESGTYHQRCPVAIAHKRIGMSVGFTVRRRICSICSDDWADCPHSPSELYDVPGGLDEAGRCQVCRKENCARHLCGQTYRVPPIAIVMEVEDLQEISLVAKPAQPDARLTSLPISTESLRAALGPSFTPGAPVSCDRCLRPCEGIEEFPFLT
jgi:hypothetical protein